MGVAYSIINFKNEIEVLRPSQTCFSGLPPTLSNFRAYPHKYKCVRQYLSNKALDKDLKSTGVTIQSEYTLPIDSARNQSFFCTLKHLNFVFDLFEAIHFDTIVSKYDRKKILKQGYIEYKRNVPMKVLVAAGSFFRLTTEFSSSVRIAYRIYEKLGKDKRLLPFLATMITYFNACRPPVDDNLQGVNVAGGRGHSPFPSSSFSGVRGMLATLSWRSRLREETGIYSLLKRGETPKYIGRDEFFVNDRGTHNIEIPDFLKNVPHPYDLLGVHNTYNPYNVSWKFHSDEKLLANKEIMVCIK